MSAFATSSPALDAARAAYSAHARAQSELLMMLARGASLSDPVCVAALGGAVEAAHTAMKRLSEIVEMMPKPDAVQAPGAPPC